MSVVIFLFSTWDADEASGSGGGVRWCTAQPSEWSWRIIAAVLCCHFSVFLLNYAPMEVVHAVGMLVYTTVYTLAADGAVFDTPKKN